MVRAGAVCVCVDGQWLVAARGLEPGGRLRVRRMRTTDAHGGSILPNGALPTSSSSSSSSLDVLRIEPGSLARIWVRRGSTWTDRQPARVVRFVAPWKRNRPLRSGTLRVEDI